MNKDYSQSSPLFRYLLRLADSSLILGQRLGEWCGHGPILEEDIALTNFSLDFIGQSRLFYDYASKVEGLGRSEDDLAFLRDVMNFYNTLITEQPNGDFGKTMVRQFLFDAFHFHQFEGLKKSKDSQIAAIAEKSFKEISYHLRHSSQWVVRLGDGTGESHGKVQQSLNDLWMFTGDMFEMNEDDNFLIKHGISPDLKDVKSRWDETVKETLNRATLKIPENNFMLSGGIYGRHTEHLGFILAEMQFLQRTYPGAKW